MQSLGSVLAEADAIIEKRASAGHNKTAAAKPAVSEDDIFKLAEELCKSGSEAPVVAADSDADVVTLTEKVAHAVALVDTLMNLEEMAKIAHFEETARERGFTSAQIADFIEKRASQHQFKSVLQMIPWLNAEAQ